MNMRDQIAAVALDAINEEYRNGSTRAGYAIAATDAILAALPGMIPDLVWQRNGDHHAGGYGYVIRKQNTRFVGTLRNRFDKDFDTLDAAKAAASAHHRVTIAQAAGWTAPPVDSDKGAA